jgi:hypothetical protein
MKETGIDRFFVEAAYVAALMVWLIENKSDHEADAEIAEILTEKPFMMGIVFDVMKCYRASVP